MSKANKAKGGNRTVVIAAIGLAIVVAALLLVWLTCAIFRIGVLCTTIRMLGQEYAIQKRKEVRQ